MKFLFAGFKKISKAAMSLRMSAVFLAGFDRKRQPILSWRQRAGRKFGEGTRRTVGFVKVNHHATRRVRRIHIQVASSRIGFFAAGLIGDDHEVLRLTFFRDRIELIGTPVDCKLDRAR